MKLTHLVVKCSLLIAEAADKEKLKHLNTLKKLIRSGRFATGQPPFIFWGHISRLACNTDLLPTW